jgi:hypothetical protein
MYFSGLKRLYPCMSTHLAHRGEAVGGRAAKAALSPARRSPSCRVTPRDPGLPRSARLSTTPIDWMRTTSLSDAAANGVTHAT